MWMIKDDKGFLLIRGKNYDVRVTVDKLLVPRLIQNNYRMRKDGHIVGQYDVRLSHIVWDMTYLDWPPSRVWHMNGDLFDYRAENLAILKVTPQSPESGDKRPPSASPSLSEVVDSSIPAPLTTLSC